VVGFLVVVLWWTVGLLVVVGGGGWVGVERSQYGDTGKDCVGSVRGRWVWVVEVLWDPVVLVCLQVVVGISPVLAEVCLGVGWRDPDSESWYWG